jgi:broad specificity phosphatase PhoE
MKRTTDQNRKMWPLLEEVAAQATLNGEHYSAEDWKLIFLSALSRTKNLEARIIRGILGEPINLGRSSSKLEKELFSELIELIQAFGAENGVIFKDDKE